MFILNGEQVFVTVLYFVILLCMLIVESFRQRAFNPLIGFSIIMVAVWIMLFLFRYFFGEL